VEGPPFHFPKETAFSPRKEVKFEQSLQIPGNSDWKTVEAYERDSPFLKTPADPKVFENSLAS